MKTFLTTAIFMLLLSLVLGTSGCNKDDDTKSDQQKRAELLANGPWTVSDATSSTPGFVFSGTTVFTFTQQLDEMTNIYGGTYTISGAANLNLLGELPWPLSEGTWVFTDNTTDSQIRRDDSTIITLASESADQLTLTFNFSLTSGRTNGVQGPWTITLSK